MSRRTLDDFLTRAIQWVWDRWRPQKATERQESPEARHDRIRAAMVKDETWDPVREEIFQSPAGPHVCPFCGQAAVLAAWGVFTAEPRTASFDAWCDRSGERHHCATRLPSHAPDSYPPGTEHVTASLTKNLFEAGKKRRWW